MPIDYTKIAEANIKKYGTDIGRYGPVLLAQLYSDRTHFIYEILQNAEDVEAKEINFHLFKDRLEVQHNGKLFTNANVHGICGLVEGTKKDDLTQIGKFGIGFKSVYAYTNSPNIYSGDKSFCIENYVLPHIIDGINIQDDETLFVFPFDHAEVLPEQAFNEIAKRLRDIGTRTLMFLNHIEEITWSIDGQERGNYICDIRKGEGHKKVYVISKVDDQNVVDEEWLVFERPLKMNVSNVTNLKVEVAFKIGKDKYGKEIIVPVKDSKLIVFFPTVKPTYLNFLIQGPYKTTPNRENIPLEDEQNKIIVKATGELVAESISLVKELGYLDVNFLNVLPLDSAHIEGEPIYATVYEKVKREFLSDEELLPSHDERYTKASDALLARGKYLTEILNQEDTKLLFSRTIWLSTDITYDSTREIWSYLIDELEIEKIEFEDFAKNITSQFLEKKGDEWMVGFYGRLLEQRGLWDEQTTRSSKKNILRRKPIIRLNNNSHIAPCDENGNIQVYLPTGYKSEYNTVKETLVDDENSLKFLKDLGLDKPDLFAEISKKILPRYQEKNDVDDEEKYFENFKKVLTFFSETDSTKKKAKLASKLSDVFFILSTKSELRYPSQVYLNTSDLKGYFEEYDFVYFVSEKLYERFEEKALVSFLMEIGVQDMPKRKRFTSNLSYEELSRLRNSSDYTRDIEQYDYDLEGLDNFLSRDQNMERSLVLWNLILKSIESLDSWDAKSFFEGCYKWKYYSIYTKKFDSAFLTKLRKTHWLATKDGCMKKSSEITYSELADAYPKEMPNIDVLKEKLHFKPDVFDQLPDDYKSKLELVIERSPKEIEEAFALLDKQSAAKEGTKKQKDHWTPEYAPDDIEVESEIVAPEPLESADLEGQAETMKGGNTEDEGADEDEKTEPKEESKISSKQEKEIGEVGERLVLNHLKKQYQKLGVVEDTEYGFRAF